MEVERPREREEEEEEEIIEGEEEEAVVGLEARQRKINVNGPLQETVVVKGGTDEEQKSVYLDSDKGAEVVLEAESIDEADFASETNLGNGMAISSKTEEVKYKGNGTSSKLSSEEHAEIEISGNQYETEGQLKHITLMNKTKEVNLEDYYDLEKVIEEQETHDLYCPNCNSCITRRVILRKRKRTVKEFQRDLPAKKVQVQQETVSSSTVSSGIPGQRGDWELPGVFRCLSCFIFFMPTESGFNIFDIFRKKGKTPDHPQPPTHISQSSQNNGNEPVVQPPTQVSQDSQNNEIKPARTEEPSEEARQQGKPATPVQNPDMPAAHPATGNGSLAVPGVPSASSNADVLVPGVSEKVHEEPINGHADINNGSDNKIDVTPSFNSGHVIGDLISRAPVGDTAIDMPGSGTNSIGVQVDGWDILKAIVYGGLFESITSLSIVSSAAAADASTLNVFVLGLANLVGGLFIIIHEIFELKRAQDEAHDRNDQRQGRYWALLGMRRNFCLHSTVAITTYILVGMLPPLIYGLSFRKSDNKEYKLIAVAVASFVCITLLSIGKAHIRQGRKYITTVLYYLALGFQVSGLSYVAGMLIKILLDKLGLFDHGSSAAAPPTTLFRDVATGRPEWASY